MAKKPNTNGRARGRNGADPDGPHLTTLVALAKRLKVSTRTVSRWRGREGFPVNADGTFPAGKIGRWAIAMRSRSANRSDTAGGLAGVGPLSAERAAAELEFRQTKTERERLTIDRERGELLSRTEIEQRSAELLSDLRRNLLVILPRRVAPRDAKLQAKIKAEVRTFLEAWSK